MASWWRTSRTARLRFHGSCGCSRSRAAIPCSSRAISASARTRRSLPTAAGSCCGAALSPTASMSSRRSAGFRRSWPKGHGRNSRRTDRRSAYMAPRLWRRRVAVALDPARWRRDDEGDQDRQRHSRRAGVASGRQGPALHRPRRPAGRANRQRLVLRFGRWRLRRRRPGRCGGWRPPDSGSDAISASPRMVCCSPTAITTAPTSIECRSMRRSGKSSGDPVPVIVGAGFNFSPTASQDGRRMAFAIGNNLSTNIWRAPVDPNTGKVAGEPVRVTSGLDPSLDSVAVARRRTSRLSGRSCESAGGSHSRPRNGKGPASGRSEGLELSWCCRRMARRSRSTRTSATNSAIYSVPAAGGVPKKICASCGRPVEWSPDRTKLLFDNAGPESREIHLLDVATGQSKALLQHPERAAEHAAPLAGRAVADVFSMALPGRARRIYRRAVYRRAGSGKGMDGAGRGLGLRAPALLGAIREPDLLPFGTGWLQVHLGAAR